MNCKNRGTDIQLTSLLIKFDKDLVTGKKFFSPDGYHLWDELNDQYQGRFKNKDFIFYH